MIRARVPVTATALLAALVLLVQSHAGGQEFKGQAKIGKHDVKMESDKLYQIFIKGPENQPLQVHTDPLQLTRIYSKDFREEKLYVMPIKAGEYPLYVVPGYSYGGKRLETIDYTVNVKAVPLGEKPLLETTGKWDANGPTYKNDNLFNKDSGRPFQPYKVQLKGGQLYVINLVKSKAGVDPYLYLEDAKGKIVAQDDDSGGDLNARIIYAPEMDGEYRIIAAELGKVTGEFTLKVREVK